MKSFGVFMVVLSWSSFSQSYSLYGSNVKRYNSRGNVIEPMIPSNPYSSSSYQLQSQHQQQAPSPSYYYDDNYLRQQYQPIPYSSLPQAPQRVEEDYNSYNNRNPSYYTPPRSVQQQQKQQINTQDYQTPLYGIPTYRGDYQPKPYYFAQPSFSSDDRIETTNPLDYLHEEIMQENERERSINNAAFIQNLALYNKHVDSLKERQEQIQQMQDMYKLSDEDQDDYVMQDIPTDWYDQTEIIVDPDTYASLRNNYDYQPHDYDDQMVKELRGLSKQKSKSKQLKQQQAKMPIQVWQPENDEYEDDDTWINWSHKRSIQPKKDYGLIDKVDMKQQKLNKNKPAMKGDKMTTKAPAAITTTVATTSMENSKLLSKLHKSGGQKEVVLFRPATPVRKAFSDSVLMVGNGITEGVGNKEEQSPPPIYRTIKQIIDMEQNLSHVSKLKITSYNEIELKKLTSNQVVN